MRGIIKCVYCIVIMSLFLISLFSFFEIPKLKILEIKDLTLSKTVNVFNSLSNIQHDTIIENTSLNVESNTNKPVSYPTISLNVTTNVHSVSSFLQEQYRRQDHIHSSCKKIDTINLRSSLTNLVADRQHHLTFCPVYKASSTSWLINLLELNGKWKEGDLPKLQDTLKRTFQKIYKSDDSALSKSSNRFLVVRHPFERLVSCFRDKIELAKKPYYYGRYGETIVGKYRLIPERYIKYKKDLLRDVMTYVKTPGFKPDNPLPSNLKDNPYASPIGPIFPEFTRFVLESIHEDEHWKPMYKWCSLCKVDYNVILKFENLDSESQYFIEYLNYSSLLKTRWDNPTKGGNTSGKRTCEYFKQLQVHTVNGLIKKYSNDLLLFDYSPDKYLNCAENK